MNSKPSIWVDFENAPHVWVLSPIIRFLQERGYPLILTARDFSYTVGLCRRLGYDAQVIGLSGPGSNRVSRVWRVLDRASRLYMRLLRTRKRVGLALSHGSRSQTLAGHYLGIPVVSLDDYEFSDQSLVRFVDRLLVPFPIPRDIWGRYSDRVSHYPGLKEELYLCGFRQDPSGSGAWGRPDQIKVLFRCESRFAHYHSAQTAIMQGAILRHLGQHPGVFLVLLPRDNLQAKTLLDFCAQHGVACKVPGQVLDGPSLIWDMDLVISGGGTMAREAAVLGVPSYSFFAGQWGAVDRYLQTQGRLVQLADVEDLEKIVLKQRTRLPVSVSNHALDFVTDLIQSIITR